MAIASTTILFIYLGFLLLLLAIPIMIGIYVYRDASRRKMNALLWTFVAVITPVFVGLIIYLLVRGNDSDLMCPVCQQDVMKDYTVCPGCGARLRRVCEKCGYPVEEDWSVCPSCAAPLHIEGAGEITPPVHKKDKGLWKILLAVILIPVLLFIVLLVNVSVSTSEGGSSGRISSYAPEDMEKYREVPEIWDWITTSQEKDPSGIYVLHYQEERDGQKGSIYLIYRPSAENTKGIQTSEEKGWFSSKAVVSFEDTDDSNFDHTYSPLTYISKYENEFLGLEIQVNGETKEFEQTEIDFDPILEIP